MKQSSQEHLCSHMPSGETSVECCRDVIAKLKKMVFQKVLARQSCALGTLAQAKGLPY